MSDERQNVNKRGGVPYLRGTVSAADPNQERRDYVLNGESPLVGLIDNPWYPPYMQDRSHYHNCMEIGICLSGCGQIEMKGQVRRFETGVVVAVGRGLHHSQQNEGPDVTHWRYVLLDEDLLLWESPARHRPAIRRLLDAARQQGLYFAPDEECRDLRLTLDVMFDVYGRRGELASMELENMAHLLVSVMARSVNLALDAASPRTGAGSMVEPALQYVSENYMHSVTVAQMAACCAMSESYFRKVFTASMHMAPLEYVNRYRINRAANLMWSTAVPIHQIAAATGFSSPATFNRNFRRYTGQSPAQWRRSSHI